MHAAKNSKVKYFVSKIQNTIVANVTNGNFSLND